MTLDTRLQKKKYTSLVGKIAKSSHKKTKGLLFFPNSFACTNVGEGGNLCKLVLGEERASRDLPELWGEGRSPVWAGLPEAHRNAGPLLLQPFQERVLVLSHHSSTSCKGLMAVSGQMCPADGNDSRFSSVLCALHSENAYFFHGYQNNTHHFRTIGRYKKKFKRHENKISYNPSTQSYLYLSTFPSNIFSLNMNAHFVTCAFALFCFLVQPHSTCPYLTPLSLSLLPYVSTLCLVSLT
jgi:hypothetical protein